MLMRAYSELTKRDPKAMHPMSPRIHRFDNNIVPQLHKVLKVESRIRDEALGGSNPGDRDVFFVNILFNHTIQILLGRKMVTRGI
jgi:hypothetical protein